MAAPHAVRPVVLVAEDEPMLAELLHRALRAQGYKVLTAPDGVAALSLLQSAGAPVDLLVADIRMPGMFGDQLAFAARELGLIRQVLFITGYDVHPDTAQMLGPVLVKPFDMDDLVRAVAELLKQPLSP